MDDLISRQVAIDALNKMKIYRPLDSDRYVISDCLSKIINLHSAQSTGTWLVAEGACEPDYMECSKCGWITEYYGGLEEEWNYCPHCGARMERE